MSVWSGLALNGHFFFFFCYDILGIVSRIWVTAVDLVGICAVIRI